MPSFRATVIRQISRQYMLRASPDRDAQKMRESMEFRMGLLPPAHGVVVRQEEIDGVPCELHVPTGCENAPLIFYLHGGGYVMGSPRTHRRLVSFIARKAGMRALLPDYRLAPEHRYPVALQDSLRVYHALLKGGADPRHMAIGGDSAGGNLTVATLLSLRDEGAAIPAACFLLSPWLDLAGEGESHRTRASVDPWFRPDLMPAIVDRFCDEGQRHDPLVSPVLADASGLPATLIQVGDHEILLSDSTRLAENIKGCGGRVELQVWPEMWHVFQFFIGQMPESTRAIDKVGDFLQQEFAADRRRA